jgi:hypothetical protein
MSQNKHPVAVDIEKYLAQVFGVTVDLAGVEFPQVAGAQSYMLSADCVPLSTQAMWDKLVAWAKPQNQFISGHLSTVVPIAQPLKVFAHVGGDEPDTTHLSKSYNDAKSEKLDFMGVRDYILVNGFHFRGHHKWMDPVGWTQLDSFWSGGSISGYTVIGGLKPWLGGLSLYHGYSDDRHPKVGPRQRFWVS